MKRLNMPGIMISLFLVSLWLLFVSSPAFSEDAWMPEFEELCGQTEQAGEMTKTQLLSMVERCDKLRPAIESSDNPQKKVFLFRLEKCKKLYSYMAELAG